MLSPSRSSPFAVLDSFQCCYSYKCVRLWCMLNFMHCIQKVILRCRTKRGAKWQLCSYSQKYFVHNALLHSSGHLFWIFINIKTIISAYDAHRMCRLLAWSLRGLPLKTAVVAGDPAHLWSLIWRFGQFDSEVFCTNAQAVRGISGLPVEKETTLQRKAA